MSEGNHDIAQDVRQRLGEGVRILELRNNMYVPLLRRKEYGSAKAVLDILLQHAPQDVMLLRDAASLHLKLGDAATSVDCIAKALTFAGSVDQEVTAHAIQIYLAAGRIEEAVKLAKECRQDWDHNLRLAHLSFLAFSRTDTADPRDVLQLAKKILAANDATSGMRERAGLILLNFGEARACLDALQGTTVANEGTATELFVIAKAHHMTDRKSDAADTFLDRCLQLQPDHLQASELRSLRYLEAGDFTSALDCLKHIKPDAYTKGIKLNYAVALSETGGLNRSVSMFKELLSEDPRNNSMRKKIAGTLAKNNQLLLAQELYQEGIEQRSNSLKPTFKECIDSVLSSDVRTNIPKYRSDMLFDALSIRGISLGDKSEWEADVHQHHALDKLIVDWVECRPEAFDEIRPYLAPTEKSVDLMNEINAEGKGLIVASAHIGMLFAGPVILRALGYPFKWLASLPKLDRDLVDEDLISTTSLNEQNLTREFMRALRDGKTITIAIDGAAETQRSKYPFLGEMIGLSEFVPLIAYRKGTPTVVPKLLWKDNKIHIELIKLPKPLDNEDAVAFVSRWMTSFLRVIEETLMENPEQPRLAGGFWATLNR